jgi:transcriptional regulator with XRE-family HTH domain
MQLKLKQAEAANLLGISTVSLSKWERKLIVPNARYDLALSRFLGAGWREFLTAAL